MKRFLILTIVFIMISCAFPGCGKSKKESDSSESDNPTSETTAAVTTNPQKYTGEITFDNIKDIYIDFITPKRNPLKIIDGKPAFMIK